MQINLFNEQMSFDLDNEVMATVSGTLHIVQQV